MSKHHTTSWIKRLELWLGSEPGQRFLHRSYSWGAALVILGALFKILELPYANELLLVSMLGECCIFLLSGLDSSEHSPEPQLPQASLQQSLNELTRCLDQLQQTLASGAHTASPLSSGQAGTAEVTDKRAIPQLQGDYQSELSLLTQRVQELRLVYEQSLQGSSEFQQQNEQLVRQLMQLNALYAQMIERLAASTGLHDRPLP